MPIIIMPRLRRVVRLVRGAVAPLAAAVLLLTLADASALSGSLGAQTPAAKRAAAKRAATKRAAAKPTASRTAAAKATAKAAPKTRPAPATRTLAVAPPESAYFGAQVDTLAEPDPATMVPRYPTALRTRGTPGTVLAQFVVDTTGRVDMRTFKILSSTDTAFSLAVRSAVSRGEFLPALLDGRKVRQIVEQPFRFGVETVARPGSAGATAAPPR